MLSKQQLSNNPVLKRTIEMYDDIPDSQREFVDKYGRRYVGACLAAGLRLATVHNAYNSEPKTQESQKYLLTRLRRASIAQIVYKNLTDIGYKSVFLQGYNKFDKGNACDIEMHCDGSDEIVDISKRGMFKKMAHGTHKFIITGAQKLDRKMFEHAKNIKKENSQNRVHLIMFRDTKIPGAILDELQKLQNDEIIDIMYLPHNRELFNNRLRNELETSSRNISEELTPKIANSKYEQTDDDLLDVFNMPLVELVLLKTGITNPDEAEIFIHAFGEELIRCYYACGTNIDKLAKYARGEITETNQFVYPMFKTQVAMNLLENGINPQSAIKTDVKNIDFDTYLKGTEPFIVTLPNGEISTKYFNPGNYAIKLTSDKYLSNNIISELLGMQIKHDNAIILISKDTKVSTAIYDKINSIGVEVYKSGIIPKESLLMLENSMNQFQETMNSYERMVFTEKCRMQQEKRRREIKEKRSLERPVFKELCDEVRDRLSDEAKEYIKIDKLVCILGETQIRLALTCGYDLEPIYKFLRDGFDSATYKTVSKQIFELKMLEFYANCLRNSGITDIRFDSFNLGSEKGKPCIRVNIDSSKVVFQEILKDGRKKVKTLDEGSHIFVTNPSKETETIILNNIDINRLDEEKVHIIVAKDHKPIYLSPVIKGYVDILTYKEFLNYGKNAAFDYRNKFLDIRKWDAPIEYFSI